jgi:ATP-dependent helicase/nuclease subunit B
MPRGRLICGEYRALEQALWTEIDRLRSGDPLRRLTVVAPSHWLVRHLKLGAIRRHPEGVFGVRILNLYQLVVGLAGDNADRLVSPILTERLLLEWLESLDTNAAAAPEPEVRTYDLAAAVAAAVRDLRDAALEDDPALIIERLRAATVEAGTRLHALDIRKFSTLLQAYRHYTTVLRNAGLLDDADLHREAAVHSDTLDEPLLLYGFYDMTQVQADFVSTVARHVPTTLFVPGGADRDTWRFGDWFRDTLAPSITAETLQLPAPGQSATSEIHTASGERDEVWFAAKSIRELLDDGIPPDDIAVVARTLEPYLRHLEALFDEHAIAYEAPSSVRLRDQPLCRVVCLMFRAALDGLPRSAVITVLHHPLFRAAGPRDRWQALADGLRILHGEDWQRLDRYTATGYRTHSRRAGTAHVPAEDVRALRSAVAMLADRAWPGVASWDRHARAHLRAIDACINSSEASPVETVTLAAIREVLGSLGRLDRACAPVSRQRFLDTFERECRRRPVEGVPHRGVAVLDAMAVRGLSFRHVFLLGMNARAFPRFILEEPFISDSIRREVFRVLGHHLSVRMDGYAEERLLFHLVATAAQERLVCVYQRADSQGRLRDPSPFIRQLRPHGDPPPRAIPHAEVAQRAWPAPRTPPELILAADDATEALAVLGGNVDGYARGRAFLAAIEQSNTVGEQEGFTGHLVGHWNQRLDRGFSATQLELFGQCPFRYYAQEVLRLSHETSLADQDADFSALELGRLTHAILEHLYATLQTHDFDPARLVPALDEAATRVFADFEHTHGVPVRGLLNVRRQQIVRAVAAFAEFDLAQLGPWRPSWFEESACADIAGIRCQGVLDRIDRHRETDALRVVEYKLRFRHHWSVQLRTQAQRGRKLQAPVYVELAPVVAARHGHHHALTSEAVFQFIHEYTTEDPALHNDRSSRTHRRMAAVDGAPARATIQQAIGTFAALIHDGWFFPRPDDGPAGHCRHCDFAGICRKDYPGVGRRIQPQHTPALEPYWDIIRGRPR